MLANATINYLKKCTKGDELWIISYMHISIYDPFLHRIPLVILDLSL
jgi:hypothetical protein